MQLSFRKQTVVVTGAGGGIGSAYARAFAERGANVLVNDVNPDAADKVVAEITAAGGKAVANSSSVLDGHAIIKSAVDAFGSVDILVNNAGTVHISNLEDYPDDKWNSVVDTHILGTVSCTQAVWPLFCAQGYGRIVSTTSCWALFGYHEESAYSAAKAGIIPFTKAIAKEGAAYGIKANAIAPVSASGMTNPVLPQEILRGISPEFIAPLVLALTHRDEGLDVTGRIFEVAAGWIAEVQSTRSDGIEIPADAALDLPSLQARWHDIAPDFATQTSTEVPANSYDGLTVIVTNATSVQGRSHTLALAKCGANVVATDTEGNLNALQELVREISESDVAGGKAVATIEQGQSAVKAALDAFGGVHAIVASAAFSPVGSLTQVSTRKWDDALTIHLRTTHQLVKACWPIFKAQKFGCIVTTASTAGIHGLDKRLPFSVANGALMGFTRALALEGKPHGILANIVAPSAAVDKQAVDGASIAAVAAFLVGRDAAVGETNGALIEVGAGRVGQDRWLRSGGHSFRHDRRLTPEDVIEKWDVITDYEDGRAKYVSLFEHTLETMMANFDNKGDEMQL